MLKKLINLVTNNKENAKEEGNVYQKLEEYRKTNLNSDADELVNILLKNFGSRVKVNAFFLDQKREKPSFVFEKLFERTLEKLQVKAPEVAKVFEKQRSKFVKEKKYDVLASSEMTETSYAYSPFGAKTDAENLLKSLGNEMMVTKIAKKVTDVVCQEILLATTFELLKKEASKKDIGNDLVFFIEAGQDVVSKECWEGFWKSFQHRNPQPKKTVTKNQLIEARIKEVEDAAQVIVENLGSPFLKEMIELNHFIQYDVELLYTKTLQSLNTLNESLAIRLAGLKDLMVSCNNLNVLVSQFTDVWEMKQQELFKQEELRKHEELKKQEELSRWEAKRKEILARVNSSDFTHLFNKEEEKEEILSFDENYEVDLEELSFFEIPQVEIEENIEETVVVETTTVPLKEELEEEIVAEKPEEIIEEKEEIFEDEKEEIVAEKEEEDPIAAILNGFEVEKEEEEQEHIA